MMKNLLASSLVGLLAWQPILRAASNLPSNGSFVAGSGNISPAGNILTINQNSLKGIIDWNTFSISPGATVSFKNGSGATLNRVTGSSPTSIFGQLLATGSVYLLNPEGILIGQGSTIHTGGDFVATTIQIPNSFFLQNKFEFTGNSTATVINLGDIASTGGNIYLIGRTVQNSGNLSARNGTIGLVAGSQVLITDSSTGQKVAVEAPGGDLTNSGFIHAAQIELKSNGGNIYALAGNNGGLINASGTATEDGHVWLLATNGTTNVAGAITATNANGSGGEIETSGAHVDVGGAQIKTGTGGHWLLDPDDLLIDSSLAGTIEGSLNGGTNVIEQTGSGNNGNGDLTVASNIAWTTGANLTLSAFRNINFNSGVLVSNTGSGNLTVRADNTSIGTGTISFADSTAKIDFSGSTGNVALLYNPSSYASPTSYSTNFGTINGSWVAPVNGSVSSQYTAYMLVNSGANLENLDANDAGTYALGKDIDISSIANFVPLAGGFPYFGGILDGQGHTINGLTMTDSSGAVLSLFGRILPTGKVRNLNFTNVSLTETGNNPGTFGTIAFLNRGTISNVSVAGVMTAGANTIEMGGLVTDNAPAGTIQYSSSNVVIDASLSTNSGSYIGGLVGDNNGAIKNSYATGSVSAANMTASQIGGLIGYNEGILVSNSYATGAVTGGAGSNVGGLAGQSSSAITDSYASGAVVGGGSANLGGLVGQTVSGGTIDTSYATGSVSTTGDASSLGGLVGNNQDSITRSFAAGSVTGSTNANAGGLVGYSSAPISVSYAIGSAAGDEGSYVGGLVGYAASSLTDTYARGAVNFTQDFNDGGGLVGGLDAAGSITRSYSSGRVSASPYYNGGLVGVNGGSGNITSSYWDTQSSGFSYAVGLGDSSGISGLTTAQLQSGNMPTGFNPAAPYLVWVAPAAVYPYFGWQGALVTVNGTAYSGPSALASAGVNVMSGGVVIGTTVTNSNGFYGIGVPTNMVNLGPGIMTYLTSNGTANTFFDAANPLNFRGMNLETQAISILAVATTNLSAIDADLRLTLGSNTGSNFLFTSPNGSLSVKPGTSLYVSREGGSLVLDQPITGAAGMLIGATGNLTLANTLTPAPGGGTLLVTYGVFTNNAGANALPVSGAGYWQVYSQNPANDNTGGLPENYIQYNASFGDAPSHPGNGLNYTVAPTLTALLSGTVSKTYDGTTTASLLPASLSFTGAIHGDTISASGATATYADPNVNTGIGVNVSGFSVTATNGSIPVYGYQLSSPSASANIGMITPATLIYNPANASSVYGTSGTFTGTVTGFVNGETLASATAGSLLFTSPANALSNVGSYPINGSGLTANNGNYIFVQAENSANALTITPATLTYVASSANQTYGSPSSAFTGTVSGFVNGQTLASATTGSLLFASPANALSNVGSYAINGSGLTANNGNYVFVQAESNASALTMNPATLSYSISPVSQTYGSNNSLFNGVVTGLVNGQSLASVTSGAAAFHSPVTANSDVGTYAITGSGLTVTSPNYILAQAPGNASALTITPATLTYTATPAIQPFGSGNVSFTGTVTGFVNAQTVADATTGTPVFTSATTPATAAGNYAINGSGLTANHGNYTFQQAPGNATALTITLAAVPIPTPAPIPSPSTTTITLNVNSLSTINGQAVPSFTATYTGSTIAGVDISSLLAGLRYQVTPALNGPGTYSVTASGVAPSGYVFNIVPGTFTIIDNSPAVLPTQAPLFSPEIPALLAETGSSGPNELLSPVNSLGRFHVESALAAPGFQGNSNSLPAFSGLDSKQQPLAQSLFFGDSANKSTFVAGAKP